MLAILPLLLGASPALSRAPADPAPLAAHPAAPSFREAVDAAWTRLPQRRAFAARQSVAAARYAAGGAILPNAPYAIGTYVNDKTLGSNYNYITEQGELGTPVWLPGEGTATQRTAHADAEAAGSQAEAMHLELAAQVLDLSVQAALAANTRDVADRRLTTAQALAVDADRRFRVGEGSQSDALAADAEASSARIALSNAEAQLAVARAGLAVLTGEEAIPRLAAPKATAPIADLMASHPRLIAAERAVDAAQANARLVRIENRDNPEVGVQVVNEKQPGTPWDTRVGVVVRLPFATEARNAPRRAVAEQAVTVAQVQLEQTRLEVLAQIRQADVTLTAAEQASAPANRAADALDRRRGQIERAWRLGEMPLIEVVRADLLAFDAELARDKARTDLDAARLRVSLAQGALP